MYQNLYNKDKINACMGNIYKCVHDDYNNYKTNTQHSDIRFRGQQAKNTA